MASDPTIKTADRTFPSWPVFDSEQIAAVSSVLSSGKVNYWTGTVVRQFETEYAEHLHVRHAVAAFNGTIALELIIRALGIGSGDEVIVAPRTFVATASCVLWSGARPVFADVDPTSGNVTAETIRAVLTPRTKAVIVVHLGGWPCDMDPIMDLAAVHGFRVIEDCAQAHNAAYKGRPVGSIGHVSAFSFCQDKIITTGGEGGLVATNDNTLWSRLWSLKDHGKSNDAVFNRVHPVGFRWLHEGVGTNGRMTEMQAAIGREALKKLPEWVERRTQNAEVYARVLGDLAAVQIPKSPADIRNSYYRFYAHLRLERLKPEWTRDRIIAALSAAGYPCFSGSCCEIYQEKVFDGIRPTERLPNASKMASQSLCFLTHPTLQQRDCEQIASAARDLIQSVSI